MAEKETMPEKEQNAAADQEPEASGQGGQGIEGEVLLDDARDETEPLSIDDYRLKLELALEQIEQQKELALRAQAELANARRRAEKDVEQAHKYSLEKIAQELLPVVDSLERALEASDGDNELVKALRDGVEMTLGLFVKALDKFQIKPVSPEGEPFDPQLHQAISMVENEQVEPNTVVNVIQKGYTLHGRIVRPAMVMVSKAAAKDVPKIDEQA